MKCLFRDGEGFLLVYSISSRSTFERIERFRDQIIRIKDTDDIPLILVGNRCDKITEREVSREEGMNMARRLKCEFIESSAKTCVNVERAFYTVVRMIRTNRDGGYTKKNKIIRKPNPIIFLQKNKEFLFKLLS
jgi:GTPase KRas